MEAARAQVTDFDRGFLAQLLLQRGAPLLNVLCGRVQLESGEADRGCAQHRGREVECGDRGNVRIALRGLREDIGHVVALVAPGVHVHGRVEDAVGHMRHHAEPGHTLRQAQPGAKVGVVGIHQAARIAVLPADEDLRRAAGEIEIAIGIVDVDQRGS